MASLRDSLHRAADVIADYRESLPDRHVAPLEGRAAVRDALDPELPAESDDVKSVIDAMVLAAEPGLMASAGPRYFGFVLGGSVDAALVADLLVSGWDQVGFNEATSPAALAFEDVAASWLKDLLQIPASASVGFVTGAQAANTVGLAARARANC